MTADQYVLGFIGMAVVITAILAFGTLAAAGQLRRPVRRPEAAAHRAQPPGQSEHHHWYDRFHFHHAA